MKHPFCVFRAAQFLLAPCLLVSCGPPGKPTAAASVSVPLVIQTDGLAYAKGSSVPYQGEVVHFTPNLGRQSVESWQGGKPHGIWHRYWSNGQVKREDTYQMGNLTHQRQWYESGVMKQDAQMRRGIAYGKVRLWWASGRLRRSTLVAEGLRPHGHVLEYAEDGTIIADAIFHHGLYVSGKVQEEPVAKAETAQAH